MTKPVLLQSSLGGNLRLVTHTILVSNVQYVVIICSFRNEPQSKLLRNQLYLLCIVARVPDDGACVEPLLLPLWHEAVVIS